MITKEKFRRIGNFFFVIMEIGAWRAGREFCRLVRECHTTARVFRDARGVAPRRSRVNPAFQIYPL
jgi:hypothetical protein